MDWPIWYVKQSKISLNFEPIVKIGSTYIFCRLSVSYIGSTRRLTILLIFFLYLLLLIQTCRGGMLFCSFWFFFLHFVVVLFPFIFLSWVLRGWSKWGKRTIEVWFWCGCGLIIVGEKLMTETVTILYWLFHNWCKKTLSMLVIKQLM